MIRGFFCPQKRRHSRINAVESSATLPQRGSLFLGRRALFPVLQALQGKRVCWLPCPGCPAVILFADGITAAFPQRPACCPDYFRWCRSRSNRCRFHGQQPGQPRLCSCSPLPWPAGPGKLVIALRPRTVRDSLSDWLPSAPASRAQAAFAKIEKLVKAAYLKTEVRWAYTSQSIRRKLVKEGKVLVSPEIALAKLMEEGDMQRANRWRQFLGTRNCLFLLSGIALATQVAGTSGRDQTFLLKEGKIFVHRR